MNHKQYRRILESSFSRFPKRRFKLATPLAAVADAPPAEPVELVYDKFFLGEEQSNEAVDAAVTTYTPPEPVTPELSERFKQVVLQIHNHSSTEKTREYFRQFYNWFKESDEKAHGLITTVQQLRDAGEINSDLAYYLINIVVMLKLLPAALKADPRIQKLEQRLSAMSGGGKPWLKPAEKSPPLLRPYIKTWDENYARIIQDLYVSVEESETAEQYSKYDDQLNERLARGEKLVMGDWEAEQGSDRKRRRRESDVSDPDDDFNLDNWGSFEQEIIKLYRPVPPAFIQMENDSLLLQSLLAAVFSRIVQMKNMDALGQGYCLTTMASMGFPEYREQSKKILSWGDAPEDHERFTSGAALYIAAIVSFDIWSLMLMLYPEEIVWKQLGLRDNPAPPLVSRAFEDWVNDNSDNISLFDVALALANVIPVLMNGNWREFWAFDKRTRRPRAAALEFLKKRNLTTPPKIVAAVQKEWNEELMERLILRLWQDGYDSKLVREDNARSHALEISKLKDDLNQLQKKLKEVKRTKASPSENLASELVKVRDESTRLSGRLAQLETERNKLVHNQNNLINRAERAEKRAKDLEAERVVLERAILAADSKHAEDIEVQAQRDTSKVIDDESANVLARYSSDVFSGRKFLIFTGRERGDEVSRIEEAFIKLGAESVSVLDPSRSTGPVHYPPDLHVILETGYIGHPEGYPITIAAKSAGCWYLEGKFGFSGMVRAAVEKLTPPPSSSPQP